MVPMSIFHDLGNVLGPILNPVLAGAKAALLIALPVLVKSAADSIRDANRRELLKEIAQGAVAAALIRFPKLEDDALVREVVQLVLQRNPPTTNPQVIERAVRSAVSNAKLDTLNAAGMPHPGV